MRDPTPDLLPDCSGEKQVPATLVAEKKILQAVREVQVNLSSIHLLDFPIWSLFGHFTGFLSLSVMLLMCMRSFNKKTSLRAEQEDKRSCLIAEQEYTSPS